MSQRQMRQNREREIHQHVKQDVWDQMLSGREVTTRIGQRIFHSMKAAYNTAMDEIYAGRMEIDDVWQNGEIVITKIGLTLLYQQCKGGQ